MKRCLIFSVLMLLLVCNVQAEKKYGWKRLLPQATFDVGVNPYNPNTIVVGGYARYIYRSEDGGNTWKTHYLAPFATIAKTNNIAYSRLDTNVIIAGGISLVDLYRSKNAGKDWSIIKDINTYNVYLNGKALYEDAKEPGHFYFGNFLDGTIFESNDNGVSWDSISKVMKPSKIKLEDGTIVDTLIAQQPTCIGIRHDSSNIILAGNLGSAVMLSADKGRTWKHTANLRTGIPKYEPYDTEVTMFYFNDINPLKVYAVITYTLPKNLPNGGLWRSDDGGYNWQLAAFPDSSFWGVACRTLSDGQEEIFVGGYTADPMGVDSTTVPGNKIVRGSFDSGKTWWVCDNEIAWVDAFRVVKSIKSFGNNVTICGTGGLVQSSPTNTMDWLNRDFYRDDVNLNDFAYISKQEYVAVGDDGRIFTNYQSEFEWDSLYSTVSTNLNSITKIDEFSFCAVGDNGTILTSRNNLVKWTKSASIVDNDLRSVTSIDNKVFACGNDGLILTSEDRAQTWTSKFVSNNDFMSISFSDKDHGYVVGEMGAMFKTSDGGITWEAVNTNLTDTLFGVNCLNKDVVAAVGENSRLINSENGGQTWNSKLSPIMQDYRSVVYFGNKDSILAVGTSETILGTVTAGNIWNVVNSRYGPVANIWSLRYFGERGKEKLYMASEAGFFVLNDFAASVQEIIAADPKGNLNIVVNNSMLTIAYQRAFPNERNLLKMRIVDMTGRVIFQKEYRDAMFENIMDNIELRNLPSGAYLVEYLEKDVKSVKKFIMQ